MWVAMCVVQISLPAAKSAKKSGYSCKALGQNFTLKSCFLFPLLSKGKAASGL
jgi:hypothetical protein